jgi:hypothetical protein
MNKGKYTPMYETQNESSPSSPRPEATPKSVVRPSVQQSNNYDTCFSFQGSSSGQYV